MECENFDCVVHLSKYDVNYSIKITIFPENLQSIDTFNFHRLESDFVYP